MVVHSNIVRQGSRIMNTLRASYSIDPLILRRFNETIPHRERSKVVQNLMEQALSAREAALEKLAEELETHPDFAAVRETASAFKALAADGLEGM